MPHPCADVNCRPVCLDDLWSDFRLADAAIGETGEIRDGAEGWGQRGVFAAWQRAVSSERVPGVGDRGRRAGWQTPVFLLPSPHLRPKSDQNSCGPRSAMAEQNKNIDILLATYNGDRYLEEQINSILGQSRSDWALLIRDDGSTDNTRSIIDRYVSEYPEKIRIIDDGEGNIGVVRNFAKLLNNSHAAYIMFCDQDDIWLPDKIETTHKVMSSLEQQHDAGLPLLVHTDLTVVDQELCVLSPSFWRYAKLKAAAQRPLSRMLVQNVVTGCTAMINARLRRLATPLPAEAAVHDWWLALVATTFGQIGYVSTPTVLYRQHARNMLGAKPWDIISVMRFAASSPVNWYRNNINILDMTYRQARAFLARYQKSMAEKDVDIVRSYATLYEANFISKRYRVFKFGFFMDGIIKNVGHFVIL